MTNNASFFFSKVGRNSVVGIATRYGMEDLILKRTRYSVPFQADPGTHPASCTMGTESVSRE